jgi:ATP-dependent DNA ligase
MLAPYRKLEETSIEADADPPPPRDNRFGRPLELAKVHWIRPELVAEITYLSWPDDGLLRHTVFVGMREDKSAREVQRERPRTP